MALTLSEAIDHAREVSSRDGVCDECKSDHAQLAKWLADYQRLLSTIPPKTELTDFQKQSLGLIPQYQENYLDPCATCSRNKANGGTGIALCGHPNHPCVRLR